MSADKIALIQGRRETARAMRAEIEAQVRRLRQDLENYEAETASIAIAAGVEVLADGSQRGGLVARRRGGRKFGDINNRWRRLLGVLKESRPDGFTLDDVSAVAAFEGLSLRKSDAAARVRALTERHLVTKTGTSIAGRDLHRVTGEAIARFSLGQQTLDLFGTVDA